MGDTKIEWTDRTWNPLRGCARVSEGCRNCYAMKMAHRQSAPGKAYHGLTMVGADGPQWNGKVRTAPELLTLPLRWKKPRRIFVNSMSDLFHEDVPDSFIEEVWAVMLAARHHTFQILTKRPERMYKFLTSQDFERVGKLVVQHSAKAAHLAVLLHEVGCPNSTNGHIWLGVSVENRAALHRIDILRKTSAAVRFLSIEPLLEDLGTIDLTGIHWVIVGGESGPGARPMHPDWVRSIRDQCQASGVPFFFKQWGAWAPVSEAYVAGHYHIFEESSEYRGQPAVDRIVMRRVGKKAAGRLLDGRTWDEFPV